MQQEVRNRRRRGLARNVTKVHDKSTTNPLQSCVSMAFRLESTTSQKIPQTVTAAPPAKRPIVDYLAFFQRLDMWTPDRHKRILELLQAHQQLTTEALAGDLGVSRETVRRDLIELEQGGKLCRVHGGAIPAPRPYPPEPSYQERSGLHQAEKRQIGQLAATLMRSGQSCFIDAGSTTLALAQALSQLDRIKVITNAVEVAACLRRNPSIELMLLGGRFEGDVPATYGEHTVAEIARYHVDLAFVAPVAVDARQGAMDYVWHEAAVARAMLQHAQARVLLAHGSKLGQPSRVQICPLSQVDVLVSEQAPDPALHQALLEAGLGRCLHP